jgi:hypothetical protein
VSKPFERTGIPDAVAWAPAHACPKSAGQR